VQACAPRGLSCTSSTSKRLRSFASRLSRAWHRGPHLAGVLAKQQRFEESFECYARAAELYGEVEVSPAGILWLAGVRASMGLVQERMGAMEPALLQYQQALELYEKHLGSWHARVGGVLVAMAGGCQRLGRRSEALRLYLRALAVFSGPSAGARTSCAGGRVQPYRLALRAGVAPLVVPQGHRLVQRGLADLGHREVEALLGTE